MPFVRVTAYSGRTREKKKAVAKRIATAISEAYEIPVDWVVVVFDDIPKEDWAPKGELNEP